MAFRLLQQTTGVAPKKNFEGGSMPNTKPTLGAFNQGGVPTIACFNKAVTPLGVDFDDLIQAMQAYVDKYVAPVWGTPAKLIKSTGFVERRLGDGLSR